MPPESVPPTQPSDPPVTAACSAASGTCSKCQLACQIKPGWFLPGEAEKAAALKGLSLQEFFDKHLAIDWWEGAPDIFVLSPAVVGEETGTEFPSDPKGRCVFFVDGRCDIHAAKPFECREYVHSDSGAVADRHGQVRDAWDNSVAQQQTAELLGREPMAASYDGGFGGLFGSIFGAYDDYDEDYEDA